MKRCSKIMSIIAVILSFFFMPLTLVGVGLSNSVFNDTYFAELPDMYNKLYKTKEKKIVIVGTSSVAFGINSNLFEEELENANIDYKVCNFGLYGILGTKLMMDLSIDAINEGDIVILAPEIAQNTLSLYFSGENTWYAIENDEKIFSKVAKENRELMICNYYKYIQKKMEYISHPELQEVTGIYSHSSFDDTCNLIFQRENNIMPDEYDANNMISFNKEIYSADFIDYMNEFNKKIISKGGTLVYEFCPLNKKSIESNTSIDELYSYLYETLDFSILGNPNNAILDSGWFYDTNYHMNSSGMVLNTLRFVSDIKNYLSNNTPNISAIPDMPVSNEDIEIIEYNNRDAINFNYELLENGTYSIIGLNEEGIQKDELIVPSSYNGIRVTELSSTSFNDAVNLKEITIPSSIKRIKNNCFNNTPKLKYINLLHELPSQISVGYQLLDGTEAMIVIQKDSYASFLSDYTWSYYSKRLTNEK